MIDWRFLFNRYVYHVKKIDGLLWDWPFDGTIIQHGEDFLNNTLLCPRRTFVDVGANVGAWTLRASRFYQKVVSYEPNPRVYKSLLRNIYLNKQKNVIAKNLALDNHVGLTEQAIVHSRTPAEQMQLAYVQTSTLDIENVIGENSLLKLDVEGAALNVVKGGIESIGKYHPTIIVEVHTEEEAKIRNLLKPEYSWTIKSRPAPLSGDWLYREDGKQVFLIGS